MNPKCGMQKGYNPSFKIYNMRWIFHAYDDDFFPSVPHGHSKEKNYKLDIYKGIVYDSKRNKVGVIKDKELQKLHNQPKFQHLVDKAKDYYNNLNPREPISDNIKVGFKRLLKKRIRVTAGSYSKRYKGYRNKNRVMYMSTNSINGQMFNDENTLRVTLTTEIFR